MEAGVEANLVGVSAAIAQVRRGVVLAAQSDVNVLITGETGTGKELVARAIHRLSGVGPFVPHNCALTPPELFDAEFFGHRRGAFTGAERDRAGLLREADGGILFLDELECMGLPNQAKLLRVLDDGQIRPVGSERSSAVVIRFLAATNRAPDSLIASGELREDLYHRLRGFSIHLPPLRERLDDVAPLVEHFLSGTGRHLTSAALETLRSSRWPGNVRQLRLVLRCACARASGGIIDVTELELDPPREGDPVSAVMRVERPAVGGGIWTLRALESEAIMNALEAHGGNRSRAAKALGIHRSTLLRRIRELGLRFK